MLLGRDQTSLMVAQACLSLLQADHKSNKCNLRNAGTDLWVGGTDLWVTGTDLQTLQRTLNNK